MKLKAWFLIIILLALMITPACGESTIQGVDKPTIVVSIVPQATFAEKIAGDLVNIVTMIPPGSSAETYSPSPRQLKSFSDASIYFTIRVPSEEANILPKAKDFNKNLKIVDLAAEVSMVYPDLEVSPGKRDPHIWLSPKRVKVMVDVMAKELSLLDPENKDTYSQNASKYKNDLDSLDEKIKDSLQNITTKTFIAYHPAFAYWADDYGLEMLSLEKDGKDATPQTFKSMVDMAKDKGIKVIFYQAEVDSRQSKAFAKEIGGSTEKIAPLDPDYIENLEKMAQTFAKVLQ